MRPCDLVVIGAGAAGLTAAAAAADRGLDVVVVERLGAGGQIMTVDLIRNFPGHPQGIAGHELGPSLQEQAESAGADFVLDTVEAIEVDGEARVVRCEQDTVRARAVIVAAGSTLRSLGVPGESEFSGRGVSQCASCDGPLMRGRSVCVVGGGDSAVDEALNLSTHAARVVLVHRGVRLQAQQRLIERLASAGNIDLVGGTEVDEIRGAEAVTGVVLRDVESGRQTVLPVEGVFVYVGLEPNTGFLGNLLALDAGRRITVDAALATSVSGIFAAGDIRSGSAAMLASSAGDGAAAAIAAHRYLTLRP